ncbi:MAG: catalase, partial [Umezawaea sp.]
QAQSAHDTFWDFVSLHTEAQHHTIWNMSDRGIPRSLRTMEGFGVHTFRLMDEAGETSLVKFHWKPVLGVHSLVWEEAQMLAGMDPDFHRRDLADAIESGAYPQWELGIQVLEDTADQMFEGIDLLDPTKIVPEELSEVVRVGKLTLDRNPTNYFAETEQVAFHTGHLVPGIEVTNDPLMQARLFSYLDTQLTRLGGPNFTQLPINAPHVPVNDNLRDGMHQTAIHQGLAPYQPNSIDGGQPTTEDGYVHLPREVAGPKARANPVSFDDHFSQAALFWASMSEVEQAHIVEAFTFELSKCYEQPIRERMLRVLANVDARLCARVAAGLGLPAPDGEPVHGVVPSPALSQLTTAPGPIAGRVVGVVASPGADIAGVAKLRKAVEGQGAVLRVIAEVGGELGKGRSKEVVERTLPATRSIEYDAVLIAHGTTVFDPRLAVLLQEAFRHCKVLGAWGDGADLLRSAGIDTTAPGVLLADAMVKSYPTELVTAIGLHRVWDRVVPAEAV